MKKLSISNMRKYALCLMMVLLCGAVARAQMSDTQVLQFIQKESKAGTQQSQIVTKLMQRGVKIEQIRRIRQQYDRQIKQRGMGAAADAATATAQNQVRRNTVSMGDNDEEQANAQNMTQYQFDEFGPSNELLDSLEAAQMSMVKKVFGRDIFNNKNLNFAPSMNLATPQNYVLGPGDQVVVDIYGASQKSEQLTVSPDGMITVPGYGPIRVSGMTVAAAQGKLRKTLGSRYASSDLQLTLGQIRTIMINVMGEVKAPGTYTLSGFATVFHALYMAGGISDIGTLRNIKVFRQGRLITVVDVYEYILNGRLAGDVRLQDNDVVQVGAYDCIVDISGNVKRPMAYEMRANESVKTLLKYAGGFTGNAYKKSVRLLRKSGMLKSVYNINEFDMANFKVDDGDSVSVDSILDRYENMVEVRGAVFRPGLYQYGQEITSVKSLIEHADGLREEAFTAHAVLRRMKANRTLEVVPVDVQGIINGTSPDVPLQNEDILFIPTLQERMQDRILTIEGEVQFPGRYDYADHMTVEDLILLAGGLTDAASTAKVDVSRRIRDEKALKAGEELAETYSFALKDGMMVEGSPSFTLQPFDIVQVHRSPNFIVQRNVRVEGEVNFEGSYTLGKRDQRLSDIIKAAGGVTSHAFVRGARLERTMTDDERARQQATLDAVKNILSDRGDSIAASNLELGDVYTVGIELDKAISNPGSTYDIVLREGDRLVVPEYNATVKVSGDVYFPNTVSFIGGKKWKYYVDQAGGFGNRAKKSKTFIVYQNGTIGVTSKGAKPEPGCEIVVPSKKRRNPLQFASLVQAGTSLASLAAMVIALTK